MKLQIAGLSTGYDAIHVRRVSDTVQSFWYFKDGTLIAVDAMNDPRAYMVAKRMIEASQTPAPEAIPDPDKNLAQLLR